MTATKMRLVGDLAADGFLDWICHRARLLDLSGWVSQCGPDELTIVVAGPPPLIDAMEMACSLGPTNVLVEHIDCQPTDLATPLNGFHRR